MVFLAEEAGFDATVFTTRLATIFLTTGLVVVAFFFVALDVVVSFLGLTFFAVGVI